MTKEEAKLVLDNARPQTKEIDRQFYDDEDLNNALDMAIKALEIVEEFEKAQIITGGRLNGRTYAYKCGLEDGKRKALEQAEYYKDLAQSYEQTINKLTKAIAEQQSEDCVSRQAVNEYLEKLLDGRFDDFMSAAIIGIKDNINAMPPVTTQRWIPVSERLPKKTGWYFVTFKTANGVAVCEASYRKPENYWTGKNISKKLFDNNEVVAWQPLPQAYEEKRGDLNDSN